MLVIVETFNASVDIIVVQQFIIAFLYYFGRSLEQK